MTRAEKKEWAEAKRVELTKKFVEEFYSAYTRLKDIDRTINAVGCSVDAFFSKNPQENHLKNEILSRVAKETAEFAYPLIKEKRDKKAECDKVYLTTLMMLGGICKGMDTIENSNTEK